MVLFFFFSSRRRHTRSLCDWSSDVCSSDLIAGVAVLLIAFLPMLKILRDPLVGLVALVVLLLGLFGGVRMPLGLPGAFAAVLAGTALFWVRAWLGGGHDGGLPVAVPLGLAVPWPTLAWVDAVEATLPYLSVALPFALVTIIRG